ncbi:DNA-binding protein, partial [Cladochytrium replicatum]
NSILYQRAIYPSECLFHLVKQYGLNLLVSSDESVRAYLKQILAHVESRFPNRKVNKLVMVITSRETREVLERWQFDVVLETDTEVHGLNTLCSCRNVKQKNKTEKEVQSEIAAILRQITAN